MIERHSLFMSSEKPTSTGILPTLEHLGPMRSGKRLVEFGVGDTEIVDQLESKHVLELTNTALSVLIAGKKPLRTKDIRLVSSHPIHPLAEVSPTLWSPNYLMASVPKFGVY